MELETENGLNQNHPLVYEFRKISLEEAAKQQESDLFCPYCKTNLPYTPFTQGEKDYFCTLCQQNFYNKKQPEQLRFNF